MLGTYLLYISSFFMTSILVNNIPLELKEVGSYKLKKKIRYLCYLFIASFFPIFLSSVRYGIGIDYSTYKLIFEKYQYAQFADYLASSFGFEIGNFILIKLGYLIFGNTEGVFAVYSILTIVLLVAAVKYYQNRVSIVTSILVMFFLFYAGSYNTIRQFLAIAIVVFAFRFIEKRQLVTYIIFILIATSFHSTAIIMLLAYFLNFYSINENDSKVAKKKLFGCDKFLRKILIIIIILSPIIFSGLLNFISMMPIFAKYFTSYERSIYNISASLILKLPVYIPLLLAYRVNSKKNSINKFYYIMLFLEFELLLTSTIFKWGFRLSYYAIFSQVILVGATVKNTANRTSKIILSSYFIGWYALQFWILYFIWGRDAIWPYVSIFR